MQLMSTALASNLVANSVDASLSDIDMRSKTVSSLESHDVSVGPFGVLNLANEVVEVQPPADVSIDDSTLNNVEIAEVSPITVESFENFNDMLDWSDLFALDFSDVTDGDSAQPFVSHIPVSSQADNVGSSSRSINQIESLSDEQMPPGPRESEPRTTDVVDLDSSVCQLLLKHYNIHVIPNMSSLPVGRHSPWRILNVSAAVRTLADVTYLDGQDVKHSNLANLFALIAIAASDMACGTIQNMKTPAYWQAFSKSAGSEAKRHLQQSLKVEFQGSGKAKYKDQLMAILAMISYSASNRQ